MTVRDVYEALCRIAPIGLQMDWDNSGIQLARLDAPVTKVLLALDITSEVIDEAIDTGAQLIVSHHPLIFHPVSSITDDRDPTGRSILRLAENRIAAISMHTCLDIAEGGVNDVLIRLFGAEPEEALDAYGCGRVGVLSAEMRMADFLPLCRSVLMTSHLRCYDAGRPVRRLAVLGGAGGNELSNAVRKGCDTYITADIKHSQFLAAAELGINLIDGDHFGTEAPVIPVLAERLRRELPEIEFIVAGSSRQIVSFHA